MLQLANCCLEWVVKWSSDDKGFRNIQYFSNLIELDKSSIQDKENGVYSFVLKFYGPVNSYGHVELVPLTLFLGRRRPTKL